MRMILPLSMKMVPSRVLKISSGRLQRSDRGYDEKVSSVDPADFGGR